jgi:phosphoribosylglycinamide formyltransferase-1
MRNTFAFYCSGNASRIIKFYETNIKYNKIYIPDFILYDGDNETIPIKLKKIFTHIDIITIDKNDTRYKMKPHSFTSMCILRSLKKNKTNFLICFGDKILKKDLIAEYPKNLINFHPSILPSFKGLNAIDRALLERCSILGNTAHYIDEGIDTGTIIMQSAMSMEYYDGYESVLRLQLPMLKIILDSLNKTLVNKEQLMQEFPFLENSIIYPYEPGIS